MNNAIYAVKVYDPYNDMKRLFDYLRLPSEPEKIAIKLNMCDFRLRETGAVSDFIVVEALLKVLREICPDTEIFLVENDATSTLADILFSYLNISNIAKLYQAEIINLAHEKWIEKEIDGYHFKRIWIPILLEECDLIITHPKLKTISLTKITCGLKNMYGCFKGKNKAKFHEILDEAIVDINLALKPDLSIVDANICQEGITGPAYGIPKKVGLFIGGRDVVAVDAFCAELIGFNPYFVGHIRKAASTGLGEMKYELKGDLAHSELQKYKFEFNMHLYYLLKLLRKRMSGI